MELPMSKHLHSGIRLTGVVLLIALSGTGCFGLRIGSLFQRSPSPVVPNLTTFLADGQWDRSAPFEFPRTSEFLLANGLKILVVEKHDVPMVYARAQIRGGSIYDPPEKDGLAYLTGWVLTEGTRSYPDQEIDLLMDSHGAMVSSVAYNESCIATLTCLSEDLDRLFPCFAEILSSPAFDEKVIEESRQYLIGDLMRNMDDNGEVCNRVFRNEVFRGHPYQRQMTGTIEGLKAVSRRDVQKFYSDYYRPDRAALIIVGDVAAKDVAALCDRYLSKWEKSGDSLPMIGMPLPIEGTRILLIDKPVSQAQITMGHIGINRTNPDRFKITVMNHILGGGGLHTRLAQEVRIKRGLTYGIYCYFARRDYTGEFILSTFTKVESVVETIQVCLDELRRIRSEPVSEKELREAKMSLISGHPLQFEQYEDIAQALVHNSFYGLPMTDITHFADSISNVTIEDVRDAAQKYLHPEDIVLTVVGPADILKVQLEQIGPVVVADPE